MAVSHIVIEIRDSDEEEGFEIHLSYSGGNDLQSQEAKSAFAVSIDAVQKALNQAYKESSK
ncbi:hypothetical protein PL75_01160 [Neisseria arctica]|uniref:Uncharacterized protein n=1 Tax=Neisseria arctica TaxID=1470200 RepID=A0A0J0YU12_9NEIS|nr:hypothetical protein [Neisseria arctica]KLT73590.1 hypothetical protein PL75_01160 [Neisseria arctica]UOO85710.1 hypothetical protein LVJ86_05570 [Neisseria arctica]